MPKQSSQLLMAFGYWRDYLPHQTSEVLLLDAEVNACRIISWMMKLSRVLNAVQRNWSNGEQTAGCVDGAMRYSWS